VNALDSLSNERGTSPSQRKWAREIVLRGSLVLEMRDPNDGAGSDPATKTRHQYTVQRLYLWRRRLPPAPLDQPEDETPWQDEPAWWELATATGPLAQWALERGAAGINLARLPEVVELTSDEDIDGTGRGGRRAFAMPPADPWDFWGDITSVPCPVPGCRQTLVWYEAGYVPGYRVCMAALGDGAYDRRTIEHRFLASSRRRELLILDD